MTGRKQLRSRQEVSGSLILIVSVAEGYITNTQQTQSLIKPECVIVSEEDKEDVFVRPYRIP